MAVFRSIIYFYWQRHHKTSHIACIIVKNWNIQNCKWKQWRFGVWLNTICMSFYRLLCHCTGSMWYCTGSMWYCTGSMWHIVQALCGIVQSPCGIVQASCGIVQAPCGIVQAPCGSYRLHVVLYRLHVALYRLHVALTFSLWCRFWLFNCCFRIWRFPIQTRMGWDWTLRWRMCVLPQLRTPTTTTAPSKVCSTTSRTP